MHRLGLEPASPDILNRPPRNLISGVFNKEFAVDVVVYGLIMGIAPLLSFVIVVYATGGGNLGTSCNDHMDISCVVVYKARAAVFASITIIILLHGFQMKDSRKSMFRMNLVQNRTLFISVLGGCLALIPTIYIDHLNESVFKMTDISWEWGLCAASVVFYTAGAEVYKALKRRFWRSHLEG
jgi:P-type Na+/K+ transporter